VSTIPEVTERDEFTVVHRTASPNLKFPIKGKELQGNSRSKQYLSLHEQNEVTEFEEVWYLAKQD